MVFLLISGILIMSSMYYLTFRTRQPLLVGGKGRLRNILKIVSSKTGSYCPTAWSFGGHLHTIFGNILKSRPRIKYTSEHIETPDGGVVKLDWTTSNQTNQEETNEPCSNIVLILPGLTGTSHEQYVLHFVDIAKGLGYQAVVMNYRGSAGTPPRTYQLCCASNSDDLELVLKHVCKMFPKSQVCAIGVSLGGLILTNYLIKISSTNQNSPLIAALAISIPWDMFVATNSLEKPVTWFLFNRYLTRKLQRLFKVNAAALREQGVVVSKEIDAAVAKANTIREFDDAMIAPMFGYQDVNDYYLAASISHTSFESIKTPLLCLNAADDPFSPYEQIPVERIKKCENVALILTHTGGHVGFLEGWLPIGQGYMDRVYKEYISATFEG